MTWFFQVRWYRGDMYEATSGTDPACQIVRALEVVGEKWSLLIVRNALRGETRFSQFRESLGAPTDVLAARLAALVRNGVLEKRAYAEPGSRERASYHLTAAGEGLRLVVAALTQWADEFAPSSRGAAVRMVDAESGEGLRLAFVDDEMREHRAVAMAPGPAASARWLAQLGR